MFVYGEHFIFSSKVIPTTAVWRRNCSPLFLWSLEFEGLVAFRTNNKLHMTIHIGSLIREEMRRQGHTNEWLADRIGVTPRTLQKIFNKHSINTQQLEIISRALGVDFFSCYSSSLSLPCPISTHAHY